MIIYELILYKQPEILKELVKCWAEERHAKQKRDEHLTFGDYAALMRHDKWKRRSGALRQVHGKVIR